MTDPTSAGTRRVRTIRGSKLLAALVGLALGVVACGKETSDPPQGMGGGSTAGKAGAAGSGSGSVDGGASGSAVGGASGSGVVEGGATSAGSNGQGGEASPGRAGAAGAGGAEVADAECEGDADCVVLDDCCSCSAVPGASSPGGCDAVCKQNACAALGLAEPHAICEKRRCVFDVSCDRARVTCKAAVPSCPAGMVPSVLGTCWGPCLPAAECSAVTDCEDCAAGEVCVSSNVFELTRHCVPVAADCATQPSCACTNACEFQCSDTNGISCFCIQC